MRDAILKPVGFAGQVYREGMEASFAEAVKQAKNPPDMKALAKAGVISGFGTGTKAAETPEPEQPARTSDEAPKPASKGTGKGKKGSRGK